MHTLFKSFKYVPTMRNYPQPTGVLSLHRLSPPLRAPSGVAGVIG